MKKKVIAVLLSLSLAAGSVPGYAVAEEPGGPEGEIVVVEEEGPQEAAAPEEPEMEEAAELPAEAPAEDALIVEDGVEIAGIEELEIPEAEEPEVTDGAAVDAVEVSEDPEIELVGDEDAEDIANTPESSLPEADKTTEAAYGLNVNVKDENGEIVKDEYGHIVTKQYTSQLSISFRDREIKNAKYTDHPVLKNNIVGPTANYVENKGQEYYWIDKDANENPLTLTAVYDPTYKTKYNSLDPTTMMKEVLPELELKWTDLGADDKIGGTEENADVTVTLQPGKDYVYDLVKVDKVDYQGDAENYRKKVSHDAIDNSGATGGNAGTAETDGEYAVIEVTFRGHYQDITKLRMKYKIERKSLDQNILAKQYDRVIVDISDPFSDADKAYHLTYNGKEQRPNIVKVTYKDVPLSETTETDPEKLKKLTGDWYTVTVKRTRASENQYTIDAVQGREEEEGKPLLDGNESGKEVYGVPGRKYYVMTVKGWGNYKETATYKYVIDQKEVEDGDIDRLDNVTFYIELDEDEVEKRIKEKLINNLENKSLDVTEGGKDEPGSPGGYKIYYYKILNGEEVPFTTKNFPNAPGANAEGTGAPAGGVKLDPTNRSDVNAVIGNYTYHIEFTGKGNFREKKEYDSPITGRFTITDKEPHLTDVYNSVKKDLVDALRYDLAPTYDATDWFKREGGSVDDPNDVEEMVKYKFNQYKYYKKNSNGRLVECRAGDNIEVSLHPQHNGKMINADGNADGVLDAYVIRIKGTGEWKDDLGKDGYIDMDEPDEVVYVYRRNLDDDIYYDSKNIDVYDCVDSAGYGASRRGDYLDRFYIRNGAFNNNKQDAVNVEQYNKETDLFKEKDIYKYGAVQYLTTYRGSAFGKPEVTITHLVRDTKDAVEDDYKNYPLAVSQTYTWKNNRKVYNPLYITNLITADPTKPDDTTDGRVRAREKELVAGTDFDILPSVAADYRNQPTGELAWTRIKGKGNYTGSIIVPTIQMNVVNLANKDVSIKVKTVNGYDDFNKKENVIDVKGTAEEKNGLDLVYHKGAGIDVKPENVEVKFGNQIIAPADYQVVIDTRSGDDMICQDCQVIDDVGTGRHVHAGWHKIIVRWADGTYTRGFGEAKFYIRSNLKFEADYKAVLPEGYTVPVGVKLPKDMAPHNVVRVENVNSPDVELNYQQEYEYECYIPADKETEFRNGTLEAKYQMDVRDGVEFEKEGKWKLVLKPVNTSKSRVEEYEGYLFCEFEVTAKEFKNETTGGKIRVTLKDEYKNGITWPGHNITGPEIGKMFRVEDTEKLVDTQLVYGADYTIDDTVTAVGQQKVTLKGVGNYTGEFEIEIMVNRASFENAKLQLAGDLFYKGEAFSGDLGEIDLSTLKAKVIITTDDMDNELPPEDYIVSAASETAEAGAKVTVTVRAVEAEGKGHYTGTAKNSAATEIKPADITNEAIFELTGVPTEPVVYKGTAVEPVLTLTDKRTTKEVAIETAYTDNNKAGTATATVTPADKTNYADTKIEKHFTLVDQKFGRVELKAESFPYKEAPYTVDDVIQAVYDANGEEIVKGRYTAEIKGDPENAGDPTVVVTIQVDGKDETLERSFTITPVAITEVTNLNAEYVYNGKVIRPDVTVMAGKKILQNKDYVVYNTEDPNVGAKELIVQAIGNYSGNIKSTFNVVPESVEGASVTGVKASYKYNGTVRQPKVKVTVNGRVLKKDVDYTVHSTESAAIGAKELVVAGIGNYAGNIVKSFSVVPAKAVVKSVKAGKKKLTVKVTAQEGATYQIQYKVSGSDTWNSAKATGTKKVLKNLKKGKKYDIRVRAFATIDGARVNGAWSKVTVKKVK